MNPQNHQREAAALLTLWLQPSKTAAELLASKYIEVKGKQFLAQNTPVKVSDWQHDHYWYEGNFTTLFPEWDGLRDTAIFYLPFASVFLAGLLFGFGI